MIRVCVAVALLGCASGGGRIDGATGIPDAALHDGGGARDAGVRDDASTAEDSGVDDGGMNDGGPTDSGSPTADAGGTDAGPPFDAGELSIHPGPGDLVIVELQGNPQGVDDALAEYIEILNISGRVLDLDGVTLAHREFMGGEPVMSVGMDVIEGSLVVLPGQRVLLAPSNGGYFGGATVDFEYTGFELNNGGAYQNRIRLLVPGWGGVEPPTPGEVIDQMITPAGAFDNAYRGRALTLDPDIAVTPTSASNDNPAAFCYAAADASLAYWGSNWGTPRAPNRCD